MFACEICDRQFFYKNSVNRHFRREHINKESRRRLKCTECDHECRFYQDLRTHIYVDHGIVCKVERRMFSDFEEFNTWKRKLEETTHYMYVKHSSSKISATSNERKTYYVCHRTGTFQSGSCGKRKLKSQGSNKINASCPSTMEVVESLNDGSVKLILWKTHVGHNAEVSRTFLSISERNWLAARISEGASYQKIMHEIQNLGSKGARMRYIKSQDIRNMRKNLINSRNRNILLDIRTWVKNVQSLEHSETCPVIYFKDRNVTDPNKVICNKDICLVVMTKFQEETLKAYSQMICVDATYCQENYEYQLITVSVFDDAGCWCPVIYCILSTVNFMTIQYCFIKVKEVVGDVYCSVFLSDENPPFYDVWCSIMPKPEHCLVHLWYVDKNWKENILKIKCTDNVKTMIYKTLKIMLTEENEKSFGKMLVSFLESLQYDSRLSEFSSYFQSDYISRTAMWAGCYRKIYGLTFESESNLETLHKNLNKEYHEGINNQQMKECLTNLVVTSHKCEAVSRIIMQSCSTVSEKRVQSIQKNHKCGVHIKRTEIIEVSPTVYKINSNVIKYLNVDNCKCLSACTICKVCSHEYSCTCVDYAVNFNICEHIHACAIIKNKINVDLSSETDEPLDSFVEEVICEEEIICNVENFDEVCDEEAEEMEIEDDADSVRGTFDLLENECSSSDINQDETFHTIKVDSRSELTEDDNLCLENSTSLYYEPFAFVSNDDMAQYDDPELQLPADGLQIVAFKKEDDYEAILVNDDDSSSFGDTTSIYEDAIPPKTAIIALGIGSEGSDSFIFRRFDDNTIIKHKVDTLFTIADFDNTDNDIAIQLNSDIGPIEVQDFGGCYSAYDPTEGDDIVLGL